MLEMLTEEEAAATGAELRAVAARMARLSGNSGNIVTQLCRYNVDCRLSMENGIIIYIIFNCRYNLQSRYLQSESDVLILYLPSVCFFAFNHLLPPISTSYHNVVI